jgi:hypothetical protein
LTGLDLPAAIADSMESPVVMRIGVVSAIVAADNITVKISGSNVLVQASYQWPAYEPLLGDRVVVLKQDAQWYVVGPMSGPINSALLNPSFEEGGFGLLPTSWTIEVLSTGAGVPTLTVSGLNIRGRFAADFGVDNPNAVAGFSEANVYSSAVSAAAGSRWTAGLYVTAVFQPAQFPLFSELHVAIQFLSASMGVLSDTEVNVQTWSNDMTDIFFMGTFTDTRYVTAPAGTAFVRLKLYAYFDEPAFGFTSFFLDNMILRDVTQATG